MALTYVATAQALRLLPTPIAGGVSVGGYYSEGDGGAATYRWDSGSTLQPNDGSIFAPDSVYSDSGGYAASRYRLVHKGVVNVRQFGAKGDRTVRNFQSDPLGRFMDSDVYRHAKRLYPGPAGTPFSGLQDADTWDWAAIQAALNWCGENGVRLEGNEGVYLVRRPLWMGDDSTLVGDEETKDRDSHAQGLTFLGQTGNSRRETDGGTCNLRLTSDCANRYALTAHTGTSSTAGFRLRLWDGSLTEELGMASTAQDIVDALEEVLGASAAVILDNADFGVTPLVENIYFRIQPTCGSPAFLEGTGANGEDLYLARIKGQNCRRGFYSDAPQSFGHDRVSWTLGLDQDGVYKELAEAQAPGYGITATGLKGTFENDNNEEVLGKGTFHKVRRGTGSVTVTGGRVEHCATLLDYDSEDAGGPEDSLDLQVYGMDFDGMRSFEGRTSNRAQLAPENSSRRTPGSVRGHSAAATGAFPGWTVPDACSGGGVDRPGLAQGLR